MTDDSNQPVADLLEEGEDLDALQSGEDLALDALSQVSKSTRSLAAKGSDDDDELATSNELAETLSALQRVIEHSAEELESLKKKMKEKRDSLKSVFENDAQLSEAEEQANAVTAQLKERKAKLKADPQVTSLNVQIGELKELTVELEETLSNHLLSYFQLTNSKSFDTSDGDQWDFEVRAKVKSRKGGSKDE